MARPNKQTVDYFPHYVKSGRTVYILESRFGNDGYAFWFKLLEILCESDGQVFDCGNPTNWEFLLAKTHVSGVSAEKILTTLVNLGKIDAELWKKRVIWVQNLIDHLANVYDRRKQRMPQKPELMSTETTDDEELMSTETVQKPDINGVNVNKNRQSKVKYSKENKRESIEKTGKRFSPPTLGEVENYIREKGYRLDPERFIDFYQSKDWYVGKNKMRDWRAAVRGWAKNEPSRTAKITQNGKNCNDEWK